MALRRKLTGAKPGAESADYVFHVVVGERSAQRGSRTVRGGGARGRENAGVSSETQVGILRADRTRFPGEGSSALGKPGPKARPRGVAEWEAVEDYRARGSSDGVTEKAGASPYWIGRRARIGGGHGNQPAGSKARGERKQRCE